MRTGKQLVGAAARKLLSPLLSRLQQPNTYPASYSAAGEDRLVLSWLETAYGLDAREIRYLDVGANHPKMLNNTFAIYERGASGVLVEPNPDLCPALSEVRPRDTVLNVGVAFDERRSAKLQRLTASVFNTFSTDQASFVANSSKNWKPDQRQEVLDEIEVSLVPINEILAKYFERGIHFISIDAEGVDFPILRSIDLSNFHPKMICIEASRAPAEFDAILNPFGYELVSRTYDNLTYRLV